VKLNYIVIPLITIIVASMGSEFTEAGMEWYRTLRLPASTPSGAVIGLVWGVIYILTTASALIVWNGTPHDSRFRAIVAIFLVNAFLNAFWSYLFFVQHWLAGSVVEIILLLATVAALVILIWPRSVIAAVLLLPYARWVAFASWLNIAIWRLNT